MSSPAFDTYTLLKAIVEQVKAAAAQASAAPAPVVSATIPSPPIHHRLSASEELYFPPGVVGEIADYIYRSSVRPVPDVALAASIALCAGIVGRSYNVSGTGLNLYVILVAKSGVGKEGARTGINRLIATQRPSSIASTSADGEPTPAQVLARGSESRRGHRRVAEAT